MKNKQFEKLSKKQLLDMAEGYNKEIIKHRRFYYQDEAEIRETFYKGIKSLVDAIKEISEILSIKHNTITMLTTDELEDRPRLPSKEKLFEDITEFIIKERKKEKK